MKLVKKIFVYKCKLSFALLYLAVMFINNLKAKANGVLLEQENGFKYRRILNSFGRNVSAKSKQMPFNVVFAGRKT